jgi:hypothetical protein
MKEEILADRRRALEESFFSKQNELLRQKLREKETNRAEKDALAEVSGINDEQTLSRLLDLRISSETLAALYLVPLVEVAWADGTIKAKERTALLEAAEKSGMPHDSPSYQLLDEWLGHRPKAELLEAWKQYIGAITESMDHAQKQALRRDLVGRARAVAEAAGGFLGLGSKVSAAEQAVLDELEAAFS